jgi:murein peptide amidase A
MIGMPNRLILALLLSLSIAGCARSRLAPAMDAPAPAPRDLFQAAPLALSVDSRPIICTTLGRGPQRIYLIAAIHGNEPEGARILQELVDELASSQLPRSCTLRIVHDMNPDGRLDASRYNSRGVDLNRNWPAANFRPSRRTGPAPLSEPEARAVHADLNAFAPDVVIVFHSISSGPFVNFDGPAGDLAEAFAIAATDAAQRHGEPSWRVVPTMGYPTPGSLGSWIGVDLQIPILTIEFRRGQDPDSTLRAAAAGMRAVVQQAAGGQR